MDHSQKLREKPLLSWTIYETSGKILAGHCNCMAGLGETFSHIDSILWAIEAGVQIRDCYTKEVLLGFKQFLLMGDLTYKTLLLSTLYELLFHPLLEAKTVAWHLR